MAALRRLAARPTNKQDAADYFARVLPDVGQHRITSVD
jgi:hypothetical protein